MMDTRIKRWKFGIFFSVFLGVVFTSGTTPPEKFSLPRQQPVISEIAQRIFHRTPDDKKLPVWVYFTDKGFTSESGIEKAKAQTGDALTPKALRRRSLRGSLIEDDWFDDIPVFQKYVHRVTAIHGVTRLRTKTRWLNGVSLDVHPQAIARIAELPFVRKISPVLSATRRLPQMHATSPIEQNLRKPSTDLNYGPSAAQLSQINVIAAHEAGYSGQGILVLLIDTGFDLRHESLDSNRVVAQYDFINQDSVTRNQPGDPLGQDGHGTSTLSALGGAAPGQLYGPAYHSNFLLAKTEIVDREIRSEEDYFVAALEWGDSLGADLASASLGYSDWYTFEDMDGVSAVTTRGVNAAIARGMTVVVAAGNENGTSWNHIIAPADAFDAISCGSVDRADSIASFSSRGPTYDGRIKPEVVARGVETYCAWNYAPDTYQYGNGTSLSTPLVAGTAALILEAHSDWTPRHVRRALMQTANRADHPDNTYGWGLIDALKAINFGQTKQQMITAMQNYPNPFMSGKATTILYSLSSEAMIKTNTEHVQVAVYDLLGRRVRTLTDSENRMRVTWDGENENGKLVASGIYFYRVRLGNASDTGKLIFIH